MPHSVIRGTGATYGGGEFLATSPVRWRIAAGVDPVVESFDVPIDEIEFLQEEAREGTPHDLVIDSTVGKLTVKNIFVLGAKPGDNPLIGRVQLADLRWRWPYKRIARRYNMRRKVGLARRRRWFDPVLDPVVDVIQYARWSVRDDGSPWKALQIVLDVLEELEPSLKVKLPSEVIFADATTVENVELIASGEAALRQALELIPGIDVWVREDGEIELMSRLAVDKGEAQIDRAGDEIVGGGHVELIERPGTRPREVHVLFVREIEMRFDYVDGQSPERDSDTRFLENVVPIPDPELVLTDGRIVPQGTWITFDEAFAAWGSALGAAGSLVSISHTLVKQAMVPILSLWPALELAGLADISDDTDKDNWAARFAAVRQHYLTTFRINARIRDRLLDLRPYLVANIDVPTGTRAPAIVYSNHSLWSALKSLVRAGRRGGTLRLATNVLGYPRGPNNPSGQPGIDGPVRPSPARVEIIDPDQGVISINYRIDPHGNWDSVLPALMSNIPTYVPDAADPFPVSFDSVQKGKENEIPSLIDGKVAPIFTVVMATPNSTAQYHRVVITPADVAALLPSASQRGLDDAHGPVREILIPPSLETARFAWIDGLSDTIEALAGFRDPPTGRGRDFSVETEVLLVNERKDGSAGSLRAIALAAAALVYASEADRQEGGMTAKLTPGLVPAGGLAEISHVLEMDGSCVTHLNLPSTPPPFDLLAIMDPGTRRVIQREVR